jgi:hypothetical protein
MCAGACRGSRRYFKSNAAEWERIRALHAPEQGGDAIARHLTSRTIENFLDAGTGTGGCGLIAPHAKRAWASCISPDMQPSPRPALSSNVQMPRCGWPTPIACLSK